MNLFEQINALILDLQLEIDEVGTYDDIFLAGKGRNLYADIRFNVEYILINVRLDSKQVIYFDTDTYDSDHHFCPVTVYSKAVDCGILAHKEELKNLLTEIIARLKSVRASLAGNMSQDEFFNYFSV